MNKYKKPNENDNELYNYEDFKTIIEESNYLYNLATANDEPLYTTKLIDLLSYDINERCIYSPISKKCE